MTSDLELYCALSVEPPETDAAFRFKVLAETCARQQRVAARRKALVVCSVFTLAGLCFAVLDLLGLGASVSTPLMSVVCLSAVAFETVAWVNERRSLILGGVRVLMR
jgi:hypothetical protein